MTLKEKIAARLKAKAAGVNLSQARIATVVARAEKGGLTDESDDTVIDAQLDIINELSPFTEMASFDDHQRAKDAKTAQEKEVKRLADIAAGKKPADVELPADTPEWAKAFMKSQTEKAEALEAKIAAINGDKVANTRRDQYAKAMEGKSKEFIAAELKKFDKMAFADDEDFTTTLAEFTQDVSNTDLGNERPAGGFGHAKVESTKVAPSVASFIAKQNEARKTAVSSEN